MKLLTFLLAFLRLGVGEPEDKPEDVVPAEELPEDKPEDVIPAEDLPDDKPDDVKSPEADAALAAIRAEKERGDRLEREMADLRTRNAPPPPTDKDVAEWQRILNDPAASKEERWYAQGNLELRATRNASQSTLIAAQDIADKTNFSRIAITKPELHKRYEARVEQTLTEMRSKGYNASREQILKNLIGEDMMNGKFTKKPAAKTAEEKTTIARGKLPGARSDVGGKNAMSEHEKRRQRLQDVQI